MGITVAILFWVVVAGLAFLPFVWQPKSVLAMKLQFGVYALAAVGLFWWWGFALE
jgi:hypothetical protein